MPELNQELIEQKFPHLIPMSDTELVRKRVELVGNAQQIEALSDDQLEELAAILFLLRRGSGGPPKAAKKGPVSLADLAAGLT